MAAFPTFTVDDLAKLSGRDAEDYDQDYIESALEQAQLWFELATCLDEFPDRERDAALARMGILAMADAIMLAQPHNEVMSRPFQSESIGSYSYSKLAGAVSSGMPTSVAWFDMAVTKLGKCSIFGNINGGSAGGSIKVFDEGRTVRGRRGPERYFKGPADEVLRVEYQDPSAGFR